MGVRKEYERDRLERLSRFRPLRDMEAEAIIEAERLCQGNRKDMAKVLGISEATVYRRLAAARKAQK